LKAHRFGTVEHATGVCDSFDRSERQPLGVHGPSTASTEPDTAPSAPKAPLGTSIASV
jgi:hypothetical protein